MRCPPQGAWGMAPPCPCGPGCPCPLDCPCRFGGRCVCHKMIKRGCYQPPMWGIPPPQSPYHYFGFYGCPCGPRCPCPCPCPCPCGEGRCCGKKGMKKRCCGFEQPPPCPCGPGCGCPPGCPCRFGGECICKQGEMNGCPCCKCQKSKGGCCCCNKKCGKRCCKKEQKATEEEEQKEEVVAEQKEESESNEQL